ncbi:MAG: hypothetical protein ABIC95_03890 [archaeon]
MAKSKILGEEKRNMNLALAVIIGLMVVIPHVTNWYPSPELDPIEIMNRAIPTVSIVIVAVVMLLLLIGLFGGEVHLLGQALSSWITFVSIAIIFIIFGNASDWWNIRWLSADFLGAETISVIIILLVFGALVGFIAGEKKEKKPMQIWGDLKKVFTGGK